MCITGVKLFSYNSCLLSTTSRTFVHLSEETTLACLLELGGAKQKVSGCFAVFGWGWISVVKFCKCYSYDIKYYLS